MNLLVLSFFKRWWLCMFFAVSLQRVFAQPVPIEWFEAARMGDIASLQKQLNAGAKIDQQDKSLMTALHHALARNQTAAVKFLVDAGANIKIPANSRLPLNWAVMVDDLDSVKLLLSKGATPSDVGEYYGKRTVAVLDDATQWGRLEMLKFFEARGYSAPATELNGALYWAVKHGETDVVKYYLSKKADPNGLLTGNLPLDYAAYYGDIGSVDALLAAGARPNLVSSGSPQLRDGNEFNRTPLMSAVISDEREVIARLLKAGADPRALDNQAIIWADLIGDVEIYNALRKAGAAEPAPFAFAGWLGKGFEYPVPEGVRPRASAGKAAVEELARLGALTRPAEGTVSALPDGTRVAVVAIGTGLADADAMLTAKASSLPGAVMVERGEIKRLLAEKKLMETLGRPGGEKTIGDLLKADVMIVLRSHEFEGTSVKEARVVTTRTGLVVGTAYTADKGAIDAWTNEVLLHCASAGRVLTAKPGKFNLVAVARVVASLNTPESRELERRLTLILAARIGNLPDVLVVEREQLDRLALESDAAGPAFAGSSWILDAALEMSLSDEGELKFSLSMRNAGKARPQTFSVTGAAAETTRLVDSTMAKISSVLGSVSINQWAAADEAVVFSDKAKSFAAMHMWAESGAAAESAWALGLRTDAVAKLRLQAATNNILFSGRTMLVKKRGRKNYYGVSELVSFRAPFLIPSEDARELSLDDQIDQANLALDIFSASLSKVDKTFAGVPASKWLCGEIWDATTLPLRMSEPVSYQKTHGTELAALRERLLAVHADTLVLARQRRNALEVQTLTGIGLKQLSWWQPDEIIFRKQVRQILRDATLWRPPLSEQSAWTSAWKVARPHMRITNGRAGQAWVRLAREMAMSTDARESFFGNALLACETNSLRQHRDIVNMLMEKTGALSDLDRGINTLVYGIAHDTDGNSTFIETNCRPWYALAFYEARNFPPKTQTHVTLTEGNAFDITGQNGRTLPEIRAFYFREDVRRLETIKRAGAGGVYEFTMNQKFGYTAAEMATCGRLYAEVLPIMEKVASENPSANYAYESLQSKSTYFGFMDKTFSNGVSLATGKLNNPFLKYFQKFDAKQRSGWNMRMLSTRTTLNGDWFFLRSVAGGSFRDLSQPLFDETYAFRLSPDGEVTDMRKVADLFVMNYAKSHFSPPQVAGRWMAFAGSQLDRKDYRNYREKDELIAVVDLQTASAAPRFFKMAGSMDGLRSMRIAGDYLIYSFVHNPTLTNASSTDMEQKGDPTFGIAVIDLRTGKETLLASSRHQPAMVPVEEELRVFRTISLIGDSAFTVSDGAKRSKHAYDLSKREWRLLTDADSRMLAVPENQLNYNWSFSAAGKTWRLQSATRDNQIRVGSQGVGDFDIPLEYDFTNYDKGLSDWKGALAEVESRRQDPGKFIYPSKNGLMVELNSGFFFWIPMDKFVAAVEAAYARKQQTGAAKPTADSL